MKNITRKITIALLLLTAVNALIAGFLFIMDPSGQKMGMTTDFLKFSPFVTYLIPGIVLFVVNGIFNLVATYFLIKNKPTALAMVIFQGVILCGWIFAQVLMVKEINPLHVIMFLVGVILIVSGYLLKNNK
ncbi:MAG: hypothetical protein IPH28_21945 [Cytophagaceae bacterium]|jgi:hypothetical protein|nr:hypothetical protein [Cytophagaceae bacterium]MBK9509300.1 hypothetical protein [Cytophagaceae bacterium]MBK9933703.1 hypothetical protein [Cytophagaceae bacterium]MBL0302583.1 hypothetical protein [Cytophagaceae bacterium]MBL0325409.1 hypothetical protein [Cytophagaceae bacterium]